MYLKVPKLVAFVSIFIYLLDSATSGPFCEKLCGKSRLKRSPGPMVWPGSCCTNLCGYNNLQIPKFPNLIQILNKEQSPIPIVLVNKTIYVEERKTSGEFRLKFSSLIINLNSFRWDVSYRQPPQALL